MSIQELITASDWGTLPDWLAAIGTFSAVGVALGLAHRDAERREAKADRVQAAKERALFREQQTAEAEERKRRLAAKVSLSGQPLRDQWGLRRTIWAVHNGSDEPITMVSVVRRALPLEEGADPPLPMVCKTWTSIEAGGSREEDFSVHDENNMREGELQFTDGNGVRWQRKEFGSLQTIESGDSDALGVKAIQR